MTGSAPTPDVPTFPTYDPAVADGLVGAPPPAGLPGYLGIAVTEAGPGTMTCALAVRDELRTPFGTLHGGVVSALVDHVLGMVCYPVIARGAWAATTGFTLDFVAPVRDGRVEAVATIVSMTKRTAVVRIEVTNGDRVVALAQGRVTIQPPRGDGPR